MEGDKSDPAIREAPIESHLIALSQLGSLAKVAHNDGVKACWRNSNFEPGNLIFAS